MKKTTKALAMGLIMALLGGCASPYNTATKAIAGLEQTDKRPSGLVNHQVDGIVAVAQAAAKAEASRTVFGGYYNSQASFGSPVIGYRPSY